MVRVYGTWRGMDGTLLAGKYTVTFPARVTDGTDDVIIPAGIFAKDVPLVTTGSGPSLDFLCPATDDPDIAETGWKVQITVTFTGGAKAETYIIDVPYANRPTGSGGNNSGVNLRTVALSASIPQQNALYKVGVPGGLAQLNSSGEVIDANGDPVTGGGGTGTVTSDSITDASTVGKAVLVAVDAPTARSALGAASAAQGTLANSALQPGDVATVATTGAYSDLTGKPTLGTAAAQNTTAFATAAQGAKADTAVQPAGLTKAAVGLGSVDNTADSAKSVLSATKLTTARTIAGVSFDGTANIGIPFSGLTGGASISQLPAGSQLSQAFTAANAATVARPTSRTDVTVLWVGDATTSSSTLPANALAGDPIVTAA